METLKTDSVVIGGGVIGLAVAARISQRHSTLLLETHPKLGQETSSRNSEVIHSGIYYPEDSNKTRWCITGRKAIYDFCQKWNVPHANVGKLLVAVTPEEESYLEKLSQHCQAVDVPFERLSSEKIKTLEPNIKVHAALRFPTSGIVDSHQYMNQLEAQLIENGAMLAYRHQVTQIQRSSDGQWKVAVNSPDGQLEIEAPLVINAAGLAAAELTQKALGTKKYEHRFCRGRYFMLSPKFQKKYHHLIYPVPQTDGLGIHVTLDLDGYARLGPDVDWCSTQEYNEIQSHYDCDWDALVSPFVQAVRRYSPIIAPEHLSPGLIGIRAKLFIDGKAHRDFVVENHQGFIHCLGIESPGLTASLAIAGEVARLIEMG